MDGNQEKKKRISFIVVFILVKIVNSKRWGFSKDFRAMLEAPLWKEKVNGAALA